MDDLTTLDILPFRLRTEIAKHVHLETLQKASKPTLISRCLEISSSKPWQDEGCFNDNL